MIIGATESGYCLFCGANGSGGDCKQSGFVVWDIKLKIGGYFKGETIDTGVFLWFLKDNFLNTLLPFLDTIGK